MLAQVVALDESTVATKEWASEEMHVIVFPAYVLHVTAAVSEQRTTFDTQTFVLPYPKLHLTILAA